MERKTFAVWLIVTGLLVGLLGNILFYGKVIGLSFPLYAAVGIGVLLASARPARQKLRVRNLWPLAPLGFFALMVAVHADSLITTFNVLATLTLGALVLHYVAQDRYIDDEPFDQHCAALVNAGFYVIPGALYEVGDSWMWLRGKRLQERGPFFAIGRGVLLALPVVLVFAVLLASADLVFADYLHQVWQAIAFQNPGEFIAHGTVTLALAWVATGALAYGVARRVPAAARQTDHSAVPVPLAQGEAIVDDAANPPKRAVRPFRLGIIESGIILGSVDLLFGAFVLIQFAYLFGGQANIAEGKFTFAEYARRGFFELVAVSLLTLGMILFLDWTTVRDGKRQSGMFRALSLVIVALTTVMLVSASRRMWLYEEAYGFTHLRVYTHVFMLWLAALLGICLLSVFRIRQHIFSLGVILAAVGFLGTLNLLDVDRYIAERNIARVHDGYDLDVYYLRQLSTDAVPAMIDLYRAEGADPAVADGVGMWLARQLDALDNLRAGPGSTLFSANASRDHAWVLLDAMRAELPAYSVYADYSWDYNYRRNGNSDSP